MKVIIYSTGLVYCSVCAPKDFTAKEVEDAVNEQDPLLGDSRWIVSSEDFKDGSKNPHICEKDDKKLHYLLNG